MRISGSTSKTYSGAGASADHVSAIQQQIDEIRRRLDDYPRNAASSTWWYRAKKFIREHRIMVITVSVVLVAIAGVSIWVLLKRRNDSK